MQEHDPIKGYSHTVCAQIRWKKAHKYIASEIENHITDQRDAYMAQGDDLTIATRKAILQMGDATEVGLRLDRTHKPQPQWLLLSFTAMFILIGALANSLVSALQYTTQNFHPLPFITAFFVLGVCYFADFTILGRFPVAVYLSTCVISTVGLFLGSSANGMRFWLMGRFALSLSYLAVLFPLVYALLIYAMRSKGYKGILLCGVGYIPLAVLLALVPTISGLILFTISALVILGLAMYRGWFHVKAKSISLVLIPTAMVGIAGTLFNWHSPILSRLATIINPYPLRNEAGFVYALIRDLLASSQLIGQGAVPAAFGEQLPSMSIYHTDYMLTILTHRFGWVVFMGIAIGITIFSLLAFYHVIKQKSVLGTLVSFSILLSFVLQSVSYLFSNLGYGVFGSLSLPFISYGNTSLLVNAALVGFMLSVFRTGGVFRDKTEASSSNPFVSYREGKLIIDFGRKTV